MNGIPYPISKELKEAIEKKRKIFIKKYNINISQPAFIRRYFAPKIIPIINNQKFEFKEEKNVKKKHIKRKR